MFFFSMKISVTLARDKISFSPANPQLRINA